MYCRQLMTFNWQAYSHTRKPDSTSAKLAPGKVTADNCGPPVRTGLGVHVALSRPREDRPCLGDQTGGRFVGGNSVKDAPAQVEIAEDRVSGKTCRQLRVRISCAWSAAQHTEAHTKHLLCAHCRRTADMLARPTPTPLTSIKGRPWDGLAQVNDLALARLLVFGADVGGRAPHVLAREEGRG